MKNQLNALSPYRITALAAGALVAALTSACSTAIVKNPVEHPMGKTTDTMPTTQASTESAAERARAALLEATNGLTFGPYETQLPQNKLQALRNAVPLIKAAPDMQIKVTGHADISGTRELNERLSKARADNLAAFLNNAGIPKSQIEIQAAGTEEPAASNDTAAGRAKNRRVELEF